ncbi:branched-chain amino acid ABC transporter permease [Anaerocolumna cellulosilytica]|uniref:Branched-chain amino acid ABC transporter permease n=1 Tax=Anaerocolumna cellulosilytica TaxID=433286 RepID=A0A6S6R3A6_9FIRM|nr:ABC transporter permease [Anaerocolumna cellulosilytica]MBB5196074.1 putative ABC transport system permease protein [Anaerocolumna cellulosilytica]BCJ93621.1 branched-chain amino acid ABC transporter permease [Anaerocolumna cellulosilytica]
MNIAAIFLAMLGAVSQGMFWAILAVGVYVAFRILNFADLTSEGSFALGGSVCALLIVGFGWNPFISLLISLLAGMLSGVITGVLHTKLKIPAILSGILTMIALYSVNLRIMGQSNTPLLGETTILTIIKSLLPSATELGIQDSVLQNIISIGIGLVFSILVIVILYWFFGTEIGCVVRATGNNEAMVRAQGASTDLTKILGLAIGNGLIALSGGLVAQTQGFADVTMGVGAIVTGLASIVIGEVIFHRRRSFASKLIAIVVGSILYRVIIAIVLQLGLNTNDLKLLTAVLVAVALSVPVLRKQKVRPRREVG